MSADLHMKPGIFCFITPFASPASCKHAEKLIDCLAPIAGRLFVVGDQRIDLNHQPSHVIRSVSIPTLHYLSTQKPLFYSAILWIVKLIWIMTQASWALFGNRHKIQIVICFLGQYYTPILIMGRLLGKKNIVFEPASDFVINKKVYKTRKGWIFLDYILRSLIHINRTVTHIIVVESIQVVNQGRLKSFLQKLRKANLYVNTDLFKELVPLQKRERIAGFMGRLSDEKGILSFLETAKIMRNSGVRFRIVGDGPLRKEVEKVLEHKEMSHVEFSGWLSNNGVIDFLNDIRLMLLPSTGEGVPNAILEAMACGTPVLATAVGGIPDLITHNETGFILPDTKASTIANLVIEALKNPDLPAISRRGQIYIENKFSLDASISRWCRVINELAA